MHTVARFAILQAIFLLVVRMDLSGTGSVYAVEPKDGVDEARVVYVAPPGFFGEDIPANPPLWSPNSPYQCSVVYAQNMTQPMSFALPGGGTVKERNDIFYFPTMNEVLSFIDPRPKRDYPKGVLSGDYGIVVQINYRGGFPKNWFMGQGAGFGLLMGTPTYPVPGDKWSRVVVVDYPFIRQDIRFLNVPQNCTVNPACFCLKTP